MPEYLAPGVFVEEVSYRARSIDGVSTTSTGFVGRSRSGPKATGSASRGKTDASLLLDAAEAALGQIACASAPRRRRIAAVARTSGAASRDDEELRDLFAVHLEEPEREWEYVPIARLDVYIEESLDEGIPWAVFEPKAEKEWQDIKRELVAALAELVVSEDGAIEGGPAYYLVCDGDAEDDGAPCALGVVVLRPAPARRFRAAPAASPRAWRRTRGRRP